MPWSAPEGLERVQALKLAAGFAAGMRNAETCGAVSGALMVLGLRLCQDDCDTADGRQLLYTAINEFRSRFEERFCSTQCRHLLGCDIATKEGMKKAREENLFRTICPEIVRGASEILEQMLDESR